MSEHIRWSDKTVEDMEHKDKIEKLYRQAVDSLKGGKFYGYSINLNNPKEIIAVLYVLSQDFNLFHERF